MTAAIQFEFPTQPPTNFFLVNTHNSKIFIYMTDIVNPLPLLSLPAHYYLASRQPVTRHELSTGLSEPGSLCPTSYHRAAQPLPRRTRLHPPVPSFAHGAASATQVVTFTFQTPASTWV